MNLCGETISPAIAGEEYPNIWNNRALDDKFFKFGMVLDMGIVFSKSIANKMGVTSRGQIQNGRLNNHENK